MSETSRSPKQPLHLKRYALILAAAWTVVVVASLAWSVFHERQANLELARTEARGSFNKDLVYRRWNASHGGVYVPITEDTPPNPNLAHIEERDLVTPSGRRLTLMNPAYMTRQVHKLGNEQYGVRGHITSLNPIRAANAPDAWEEQALEAFEQGTPEVSSVEPLRGESYLRLMRPMATEKSCLKCHATQGYKEGDLRGGISVSVSMRPYVAAGRAHMIAMALGHGLLWIVGLGGLGSGAMSLQRRVRERGRAEAEHERARAFMQTTIDGLPESMMVINRDYTIALANRTVREMAGGENPVAAGLKCHQVSHKSATPCADPDYPCPLEQVAATKAAVRVEHLQHDAEGHAVPVEIIAAPVFDEEGEVVQIIESHRDITERKHAEEALREERERAQTYLDLAGVMFVALDAVGTVTLVNRKTCEVLGRAEEEIVGRNWFDTCLPQRLREPVKEVSKQILRGEIEPVEYYENPVLTRGGAERLIAWHNTFLRGNEGSIIGHLSSGEDITDRRQAEEAARKAQKQLLEHQRSETERVQAELDKARRQLVSQTRLATIGQVAASIAHELRNPLGAVRNAAYYLKRHVPVENPKYPEYLGIIDQEISAADRVIRDMMEMARSKEPAKESVDLGQALQDVLDRLRPAEAIRCEISLDPDPFSVNADPGQLWQVMSNILLNAIQGMEGKGDITVDARRSADYNTITVRDSGPGIAAEDREQVFEPLFTTKAKGTGLGLTICRQIIERHGGTIDLLEHEGRGAAFCIRLPR